MIVKFVCGRLLTGFEKYLCFLMLVILIVCQEKFIAGGSVVAFVLPSSCSFLEVISKKEISQARSCDHLDVVCTP